MSADAPRVLLVTSAGASPAAVTPVLGALEGLGLRLRAIDVGRAGSRADGALDRVVRAVVGELAERRLLREMSTYPPDAVIAFDPGTASALTMARDQATRPAPVIAVVDSLSPEATWAETDADRYLVVDDEAAVALADHGIEGDRILPIGPVGEAAFAQAALRPKAELRSKFKLGAGAVVLVEVGGLGYDTTSQITLQLSLSEANPTYLFDAGDDSDAASALRRQVPTLGMRAKLFGTTDDAALYWRCADVVIARPRPRAVARALVIGARLASFQPEDKDAQAVVKALEERGLGVAAPSALLLTSALEQLLKLSAGADGRTGVDGAANAADIAWVVGSERHAVIDERRAVEREATRARVRAATAAADAAAKVAAPAGGLEDLSAGAFKPAPEADLPDPGEIARLRAEVSTRLGQVSKSVFEASQAAAQWEKRQAKAKATGDDELARQAERNGDAERARMHQALAEMAQLESELKGLERAAAVAAAAPPRTSRANGARAEGSPSSGTGDRSSTRRPAGGPSVDDLLAKMKQEQRGGTSTSRPTQKPRAKEPEDAPSTVDAELAALKRKMSTNKQAPKKPAAGPRKKKP